MVKKKKLICMVFLGKGREKNWIANKGKNDFFCQIKKIKKS